MAATSIGRRRRGNRESLFRSFEILEDRRLLTNVPPDLGPIANQTATPGDELVVNFTASDADGPVGDLHFMLDPDETPAVGAVVNPAERTFRWTPTAAQTGTFRFIVLVTDRGMPPLADAEEFTVTVTPDGVNQPPVNTVPGAQTLAEDTALVFSTAAGNAISVADPDAGNNPLEITLAASNGLLSLSGVAGLTFSAGDGVGDAAMTFRGTTAAINAALAGLRFDPTANFSGSAGITLTTNDLGNTGTGGPASDTDTLSIVVTPVNDVPNLAPVTDKVVMRGAELRFTLMATDPDTGDTITYSIDPEQTPPGATVDPVTGEFVWTPAANHPLGPVSLRVVATDSGTPAFADSEEFTITVFDATTNVPPDLADIADRTVNENSPLTFTVSATDANPGTVLTYSLDPDGLPNGATINPTTGQFSWTPSEGQGPGTFTLRILATDNGTPALADSETFTVTVNEVNTPPTLASIGNRTGTVGQPLTFTASATDSDQPANALTFSLVGAPPGATINPTTGQFSFTPTSTGTFALTVRVTDNGTPAASDEEQILLTVGGAQQAPARIASLSPTHGEELVSLSRVAEVQFDKAVDPDTITSESFYAIASGQRVPATVYRSTTEQFARLQFTSDLPPSTLVRVIVDGEQIVGRDGKKLDANGDGMPGGVATADFSTVPMTRIPGTIVRGRVLASERDAEGNDVPLGGVTIRVDGLPAANAVTNADGFFELVDMPAPDFFVHIDGSTANSLGGEPIPEGGFYPNVGKPFHSIPGEVLQMPFNIHLPFVSNEALHEVVPDVEMTVQLPDEQIAMDERLAMVELTVPANSLRLPDGSVGNFVGISIVDPDRLPAPLPPGADHDYDITIQAPEGAFFDTPAPISFPNTRGLAPGTKAQLISFNHSLGEWVTSGTMTVSTDGLRVESDAGSGIRAPGWHWWDELVDVFGDTLADEDVQKGLQLAQTGLSLGIGLVSAIPGPFLLSNLFNQYISSSADMVGAISNNGPLTAAQSASLAAGISSATILLGTFATGLFVPISPVVFAGLTGVAAGLSIGSFVLSLGQAIVDVRNCINSPSAVNEVSQDTAAQTSALGDVHSAVVSDAIKRSLMSALSRLEQAQSRLAELQAAVNGFDEGYLQGVVDLISLGLMDKLGDSWTDYDYRFVPEGARIEVYDKGTTNPAINPENQLPFDLTVENVLTGVTLSQTQAMALVSTINLPDLRQRAQTYQSLGASSSSPIASDVRLAISTINRASNSLTASTGGAFYALKRSGGSVFSRARADAAGAWFARLPQFSTFGVSYFNPQSLLSGSVGFTTGPGGSTLRVSHVIGTLEVAGLLTGGIGTSAKSEELEALIDPSENDPDGDGLGPIAEEAVGTNPNLADSDSDGIDDLTEVLQGLDPLGGRGFPTGVIASVSLMGQAKEVIVASELDNEADQTTYVATGSHGLAIVDASLFMMPVVKGQLDLPGDAVDVAVDVASKIVVVASGAGGLHFVDVADPMMPRVIRTVATSANQVEISRGIVYVANEDRIESYELASGLALESLDVDTGRITGMSLERRTLFTMDENLNLTAIDISGLQMSRFGSSEMPVTLPDGGGKLFVSGGIAYAAAASRANGGLATADVSNPAVISILSGSDVGAASFAPNRAVAENGSKKALLVGRTPANNVVTLLDVSDPTVTNSNIIGFNVTAEALGVAIASGIAFVADGTAGLTVINYLPFDNQGIAPTVTIASPVADADEMRAGIQVSEGAAIPIVVDISDDYEEGDGRGQVRNVELIINGELVANDVSAPFDLLAFAPPLAPGAETVTIQVRATDTGGNSALSNELVFSLIEDNQAPQLVGNNLGASGVGFDVRTLLFSFSEELDTPRINISGITLRNVDTLAAIPLSSVTTPGDRQITVMPGAALTSGRYRLTIDNAIIADRAGNTPAQPISFEFTNVAAIAGTTQWIAGDGEWGNPNNWSTGAVPTGTSTVVIDVIGLTPTVTYSTGATSVRNLTSNERLVISGGNLTVSGTGRINGNLEIMPAATLTASGPTANVLASGVTKVDGASLIVSGGGTLSFPNLSTYKHTAGTIADTVTLRASGTNSVLDLGNLVTVTGGNGINDQLAIEALTGGRINLASVTSLADPIDGDSRGRAIRVRSDGLGSTIDLSALQSFTDVNAADSSNPGLSSLTVATSGTIQAPLLTSLDGVQLGLSGNGTLPIAQIQLITDGAIVLSGGSYSFPALTDASGTAITLNGGTASFERATNIDGASLIVSAGGMLSLPAATSYTHTAGTIADTVTLRASGTNSVLDLGNLVTVTGGNGINDQLVIEALTGGRIDVGSVTSLADPVDGDSRGRAIRVRSEGAGSTIDLSTLQNFSDISTTDSSNPGMSSLTVATSGTIQAPLLTSLDGVQLGLGGNGTLPIAQIELITDGAIVLSGGSYSFPALTDASGTAITLNGGTASFENATNIDGASLIVSAGGMLSLPAATNYTHTIGARQDTVTLRASGTNSVLDLGNLVTVVGGNGIDDQLAIEALTGGRIDLASVTSLADPVDGDTRGRAIRVRSEGAGSTIDLSALQSFTDENTAGSSNTGMSSLTASMEGIIDARMLTNLVNVQQTEETGGNIILPGEAMAAVQRQAVAASFEQLPMVGLRSQLVWELLTRDQDILAFVINSAKRRMATL